MRSFKNIARLIRLKRLGHPEAYSQTDLSTILGYKNGQFLSNIERGLCNVPLKVLKEMARILDIPHDEVKQAMLLDQAETLDNYFSTIYPKNRKTRKEEPGVVYIK